MRVSLDPKDRGYVEEGMYDVFLNGESVMYLTADEETGWVTVYKRVDGLCVLKPGTREYATESLYGRVVIHKTTMRPNPLPADLPESPKQPPPPPPPRKVTLSAINAIPMPFNLNGRSLLAYSVSYATFDQLDSEERKQWRLVFNDTVARRMLVRARCLGEPYQPEWA